MKTRFPSKEGKVNIFLCLPHIHIQIFTNTDTLTSGIFLYLKKKKSIIYLRSFPGCGLTWIKNIIEEVIPFLILELNTTTYIKTDNQQRDLLYTQYFVKTYKGKESKKNVSISIYIQLYIYNWITVPYIWHFVIQHYKSTML